MGHKGARLSTKISLAGRYLVYVPGGSGVGVSRRLRQGERERLRDVSKELKPKNAGLIVRTIAEGHGLEDLRRDMRYLSRLWSRLKKKAETVPAPGLVHKEVDISLEVTRDLFNDTCESLIVDDPKRHKAILSFLDKEAPELLPKVHLHTGEEPLFEAYGIEEQIVKALERRVPLPSGGNLVIDHAEALTGDRREHRAASPAARASRTPSPRPTSRPPVRSCASCVCATSAASSSSTSSTWRTPRTARWCWRRWRPSWRPTAPRPTWSSSRRSASSR